MGAVLGDDHTRHVEKLFLTAEAMTGRGLTKAQRADAVNLVMSLCEDDLLSEYETNQVAVQTLFVFDTMTLRDRAEMLHYRATTPLVEVEEQYSPQHVDAIVERNLQGDRLDAWKDQELDAITDNASAMCDGLSRMLFADDIKYDGMSAPAHAVIQALHDLLYGVLNTVAVEQERRASLAG